MNPESRISVSSQKPTSSGRWLGLLLLALAIFAVPLAYRVAYNGKIYPGVRIHGHAVGGMTPVDAMATMAAVGLDPLTPIHFQAGTERWTRKPAEAGLMLDLRDTVAAAYAVGREGPRIGAVADMIGARLGGHEIAPVVKLDAVLAKRLVDTLAGEFDRPAQNASLRMEGTTVRATTAATGRHIDVDGALKLLQSTAMGGTWPPGELRLPVGEIAPSVTDAEAAVAAAQSLLSAPVRLVGPADPGVEPKTFELKPERLAPMLIPRTDGERVVLDLDIAQFDAWLAPATQAISRTAQFPRFRFDAKSGLLTVLRPGLAGHSVDVTGTAQAILGVEVLANREISIRVTTTPPAVADNATAEQLGIRELVHAETSRYAGSPPERIHNVYLGATQFDGLLIPPDAVFSFNENVGEITEEVGYKKGKIILDGATAQGVGGGMCQVSTTLFRAAFWTGLPIVARLPHGYRVAYYEQGAPPGIDATVFSPSVDMKFKNDTGAYLLIETVASPRATTLTFRLYGTKPNRTVTLEGPKITRIVPPPAARTILDRSMRPGTSEVTEYARSGSSVSVTRVISDSTGTKRESFYSTYRPTGEIVSVGPEALPAPETLADAPDSAQGLPPTP